MFQFLLLIIYLAFISLGLPDGLLGSAWPAIRGDLNLPISYMGIITIIISVGTIISSLQSDRLNKTFGTGKVTAYSVALTAFALFGFAISHHFVLLCLFAIPYGLGAGSVDAALNNYVALHYSSKHMSWLHCMWGIGASAGPYVMSFALGFTNKWQIGYLLVGLIQLVLTILLFSTFSQWHNDQHEETDTQNSQSLLLKSVLSINGAKEIMICFFCYCALESTTGFWVSSYLVSQHGLNITKAAGLASLFYLGITIGRAINGFLAMTFNDSQLIRLGQILIFIGILGLFIPIDFTSLVSVSIILIGLGCAPIYPCIIHSTPDHFGKDKSQAIIGVQMASAYLGTTLMPPLFGILGKAISLSIFPYYLGFILILMIVMHEKVIKIHVKKN